jgi:hypothetical protein
VKHRLLRSQLLQIRALLNRLVIQSDTGFLLIGLITTFSLNFMLNSIYSCFSKSQTVYQHKLGTMYLYLCKLQTTYNFTSSTPEIQSTLISLNGGGVVLLRFKSFFIFGGCLARNSRKRLLPQRNFGSMKVCIFFLHVALALESLNGRYFLFNIQKQRTTFCINLASKLQDIQYKKFELLLLLLLCRSSLSLSSLSL